MRSGTLIFEAYWPPYSAEEPHLVYSCKKSFLSALIGIAIDEGAITSVDQTVLYLFPGIEESHPDAIEAELTIQEPGLVKSCLKFTFHWVILTFITVYLVH